MGSSGKAAWCAAYANHQSIYRKHAIIVKLNFSALERGGLIQFRSAAHQNHIPPTADPAYIWLMDWWMSGWMDTWSQSTGAGNTRSKSPATSVSPWPNSIQTTWVGEKERIRGKKLPLPAAGVWGLRAEYTRTIDRTEQTNGEATARHRQFTLTWRSRSRSLFS